MVYTISESPVVVVLRFVSQKLIAAAFDTLLAVLPQYSGSMEPAFQRGDILFLDNQNTRINVGEIVVYNVKGRDVPIVHRVLETHEL
jgi:signal peptidase